MNVLHINQSDILGGAGIAGYRLHKALSSRSIDSRMLVGRKVLNDTSVIELSRMPALEMPLRIFGRLIGLNYIFLPNGFNITSHSDYKHADILHLHNLHSAYFNYLALPSLTKKRPTVFTLHDMWSFTGHCASSYDCQRWKTGCGKCPYPDTYPKVYFDNSRLEWRIKNKIYKNVNIEVIVPSRWMEAVTKQSMFNRFPIHYIPHGIDTDVFKPLRNELCRELLGISDDRIILLLAANSFKNPLKGARFLPDIVNRLPGELKSKALIVTIGHEYREFPSVNLETRHFGYVTDDKIKSLIYSAADVFLSMSLAESFGLSLQESLACGTPMVAYNVGGVSEIVQDDHTGFLIESGNVSDFSEALLRIVSDRALRNSMSRKCREDAESKHSINVQVDKHLRLYEHVMQKWHTGHQAP